MAAIVLTSDRLLHLALLVGLSIALALLLMRWMEWGRTAAFGLSVTTVCQVNAAIVKEREKAAAAAEAAAQRAEKKEGVGSTKKRK